MISRHGLWLAVFFAGASSAANVLFPAGSLSVPGLSTTGTSFAYTGTLTQADTIAFAQSGNPCLQTAGTGYCTNGAGVLTVAATVGVGPVGGSSSFSGPSGVIPAGTWTFGALLMTISGVGTVQLFPTNVANGLGSPTPSASLSLPTTTLSALGFGTFSQINPTITFIVADTDFTDNGGQFVLAQVAPPSVATAPIPTLSQWAMMALMLLLAVFAARAINRRGPR